MKTRVNREFALLLLEDEEVEAYINPLLKLIVSKNLEMTYTIGDGKKYVKVYSENGDKLYETILNDTDKSAYVEMVNIINSYYRNEKIDNILKK